MREALQTYVASKGGPRAEEVAALVRELFTRQREETQKIIRERLALVATEVNDNGEPRPVTAEVFAQLDAETRGTRLTDHPGSLNSGPSGGSISVARGASSISSLSSLSRSGGSFTPGAVVQTSASQAAPAPKKTSRRLVPVLFASLAVLLVTVGTLLGVVVSGSKTKEAAANPPSGEAPKAAAVQAPAKPEELGAKPAAATQPETKPAETTAHKDPKEPAAAPKPAPQPVAQGGGWRPAPSPAPAPRAADPAPKDEPTNNAEAPGYFTIDTYPWTNVSIDGRPVGQTPIVKVPVSPGTHTVVLENATDNIRQTTTINVKSGESVSKRLAF